jgi:hypothetical protein
LSKHEVIAVQPPRRTILSKADKDRIVEIAKQVLTQAAISAALGIEQATISNSVARLGMKPGRDRDHGKRRQRRKTDPKAAWMGEDDIGRRSPLSQPTPRSPSPT